MILCRTPFTRYVGHYWITPVCLQRYLAGYRIFTIYYSRSRENLHRSPGSELNEIFVIILRDAVRVLFTFSSSSIFLMHLRIIENSGTKLNVRTVVSNSIVNIFINLCTISFAMGVYASAVGEAKFYDRYLTVSWQESSTSSVKDPKKNIHFVAVGLFDLYVSLSLRRKKHRCDN